MDFIKTLNNNIRHDIRGNYSMARLRGRIFAYGYLARKTWALTKAVVKNKTVNFYGRQFFDTWP